MKYSDYLAKELKNMCYTHCMFVAGGNIMHLLDSSRSKFKIIPFVHEVGAAIACEYFNEFNSRDLSNYFSGIVAFENKNKLLQRQLQSTRKIQSSPCHNPT
mgnify:CR=1 FL=1